MIKIEVMLEHFTVPKRTQFGTIEKSTGQDKVYAKNELGIWKPVGYVSHSAKVFTGLVDFPKELGEIVAAECSKLRKETIRFAGAPDSIATQNEDDEDDELE
jgi:hypothetical protein